MADSFLSLDNDRFGTRFGAPNSLSAGAVPLEAGNQQTHHRRADIPRVLWTHIQYFTWRRTCHERFVTLACRRGEAAQEESWRVSHWPRLHGGGHVAAEPPDALRKDRHQPPAA
jgi:hypothetical protein